MSEFKGRIVAGVAISITVAFVLAVVVIAFSPSTPQISTGGATSSSLTSLSLGQQQQYPLSAHDDLTSINLNFTMGLNATNLPAGHTIGITLSLRNDLDSANNVTADAGGFASLPDVSLSACGMGEAPYGILVAQGYYASNNVSSATPLVLYASGIYNCPAMFQISSYLFSPQSTNATLYGGCGASCGSFDATSSISVDGSWTTSSGSSATFGTLSPGTYTVVAVTEWRQMDILHFSVSSS